MNFSPRSALVVLALAVIGLWLARPVFDKLMLPGAYARRRVAWLVVTAAVFSTPSIWLFMSIGGAVLLWLGRRDPNPAALYLMLLPLVPPLTEALPGLGIVTSLFDISWPRLLSLLLLLPIAFARLPATTQRPAFGKVPVDWLVLAFMTLQVLLYWPYYSLTSSLRQMFLLLLDLWLPYYVLSRAFVRLEEVRDAAACFVLTMVVFASIALAEVVLATAFYSTLGNQWGISRRFFAYLLRDGILRAQGASGQPIIFGYQFALALGLWLALREREPRATMRWLGVLALSVGLVAALSRGPWLGAAVIVVVFALFTPGAASRLFKLGAATAVAVGALLVSPWQDRVIRMMPFIGDVDSANVEYRQRIIEVAGQLILDKPWFGNPLARAQLEELRQGQGIIDIVNTYIAFGLAYGGVGVALWAGCFLVTMFKLIRVTRVGRRDPERAHMAAAFLALLAGVMVILATTSNYLTVPLIYWALMGCALAVARLPAAQGTAAAVRPASAGGARAARPASPA